MACEPHLGEVLTITTDAFLENSFSIEQGFGSVLCDKGFSSKNAILMLNSNSKPFRFPGTVSSDRHST